MQSNETTSKTAPAREKSAGTPGQPAKAQATGGRQRMSTPQMLHLMRLEVEGALRTGNPVSCVLVCLDGFDADELVLLRKQLMPRIFHELKTVTFENSVRGLGIWTEVFQLAVFPHVTPEQVQVLAEGLREKARAIEIPGRDDVEVTLSIGVSHNLHKGPTSFETLVEEAETGMGMAQAGGGDRIAMYREAESELDALKEELEAQLKEIEQVQEKLFGDDAAGQEELWGKNLISKVIKLFHTGAQTPEVLHLEKEVIALLKVELASLRETSTVSQLIESQRQIENLERRISKLTESLGTTEAELKKIAAMKNIDLGVASIYRTVQGLTSDDENFAAKGEMLKNIFEANLALRGELDTKE